ncbi:hypothetical protein RYA05_04615 [Pseudomonas syringae pv. actinidiae]|nr:hypothetical protein [Pseudomonas syringae pv. actinidiae]
MPQAANTVYIHPGMNTCNVYLIPYPMRPGQSPGDINVDLQHDWRPIAKLDSNLRALFCEHAHLKSEIEGQMGGTFFHLDENLNPID